MKFTSIKIHPTMNSNPPRGVINQMDVGLTPPAVIAYSEPEKNKIPAKNNQLIVFFVLIEKPV